MFDEYLDYFRKTLPIGISYDIKERNLLIGGKNAYLYFIDGLLKGEVAERIMSELYKISESDMKKCKDVGEFIKTLLNYAQATPEKDPDNMIKAMLSGLAVMLIDGYSEAIVMDIRTYPTRSVEEPEKEKSLRGPKDGLVETILFNTDMIRRRLREPNLVFEMVTVGTSSKTDVCICYVRGKADESTLNQIKTKIKGINLDTLTVCEQSLVEAIGKSNWLNPLPKVRYTQRPDTVSAHLTEGKIAVIVDTSPTAILIPTSIFDFFQNTDDYYFPILTGNYLRILRIVNMLLISFLTPVYLLITQGDIPVIHGFEFIIPDKGYAISIFWQLMLLEFAVDGLKLASLNTPTSLGMSLSVIGALILGDFAVKSGWFIPQTILCTAVLALAGFTQPSIELGYAIKFMRIFLLIGARLFGIWGALAALAINAAMLVSTKNIVGTSYLYPLLPFNWNALKRLLFRTRKPPENA